MLQLRRRLGIFTCGQPHVTPTKHHHANVKADSTLEAVFRFLPFVRPNDHQVVMYVLVHIRPYFMAVTPVAMQSIGYTMFVHSPPAPSLLFCSVSSARHHTAYFGHFFHPRPCPFCSHALAPTIHHSLFKVEVKQKHTSFHS